MFYNGFNYLNIFGISKTKLQTKNPFKERQSFMLAYNLYLQTNNVINQIVFQFSSVHLLIQCLLLRP
jgi:hypothetical protein